MHLRIAAADLASWDTAGQKWTTPGGRYRLYVGDSSRNLPLETTIRL